MHSPVDNEPTRRSSVRPAIRTAWLPLAAITFIATGFAIDAVTGIPSGGRYAWYVGLALTGTPVVWRTVRGALRGHFAADVVATLAVVTAALLLQPIVGLVIVLMQTGGEALERYAEGRASNAVRSLENTVAPGTVLHGVLRRRVLEATTAAL